MQNDENAVIRYLMKEMDPSEEVLMERAMMEDDDLLIEVESMRQTLHRLDGLPDKEPPADLTESIIDQAAQQKEQTSRWPSIPREAYKYAAVLLIGMGMGSGLWMALDTSDTASGPVSESAAVSATSGIESSGSESTEPWVDRQDVLYFQDMFNVSSESSGYDNIMQTSTEKLTPVQDQPLQTNPNARGVQLTGTRN